MEDNLWDENYRNMPDWAKKFSSSKTIFCARLKLQLQKNEDRSFIDRCRATIFAKVSSREISQFRTVRAPSLSQDLSETKG